MTRHWPDLDSDSYWFKKIFQWSEATTQIWVVTLHQYAISALFFLRRHFGWKQVVVSQTVGSASVFKSQLLMFVRTDSNLGVPVVQKHKFLRYRRWLLISSSCLARKLDSFLLDFVSVSDERRSIINDYL